MGIAEYHTDTVALHELPSRGKMAALGFEIMLGAITVGGTIVAADHNPASVRAISAAVSGRPILTTPRSSCA